jgi:hypothetical protein
MEQQTPTRGRRAPATCRRLAVLLQPCKDRHFGNRRFGPGRPRPGGEGRRRIRRARPQVRRTVGASAGGTEHRGSPGAGGTEGGPFARRGAPECFGETADGRLQPRAARGAVPDLLLGAESQPPVARLRQVPMVWHPHLRRPASRRAVLRGPGHRRHLHVHLHPVERRFFRQERSRSGVDHHRPGSAAAAARWPRLRLAPPLLERVAVALGLSNRRDEPRLGGAGNFRRGSANPPVEPQGLLREFQPAKLYGAGERVTDA